MAFRRSWVVLTPPSIALLVISVARSLIVFLVQYAGIRIPAVNAARAFDILSIGFIVLTAGVLFRGV